MEPSRRSPTRRPAIHPNRMHRRHSKTPGCSTSMKRDPFGVSTTKGTGTIPSRRSLAIHAVSTSSVSSGWILRWEPTRSANRSPPAASTRKMVLNERAERTHRRTSRSYRAEAWRARSRSRPSRPRSVRVSYARTRERYLRICRTIWIASPEAQKGSKRTVSRSPLPQVGAVERARDAEVVDVHVLAAPHAPGCSGPNRNDVSRRALAHILLTTGRHPRHATAPDDTGRHVEPDFVRSSSNLRIRWPRGRGSSSLPSRTPSDLRDLLL